MSEICLTDRDCEPKEQCFDGECRSTACSSDEHCAPGKTCQDHVCTDVSGCTGDEDCNGARCDIRTGDCVECLGDADCSGSQRCIGLGCRPECIGDEDCAEPVPVCDDTLGACVQCLEDADCDGDDVCLDSQCVSAGGCRSDVDCPGSFRCDVTRYPHACVECLEDADCGMECRRCVENACFCGCPSGYTICGEECVNTGTDPDNCGGCGNVCTVQSGTPACSMGSCNIASCTAPFADCDGSYENGCEADLDTDRANCGACGNDCMVEGTCVGGVCQCPDSPGIMNCGGECVDTTSDSDNCGGCGDACTTTTRVCENSQCLTGTICIHAGEMVSPPNNTYGPGPVYATACDVCTLSDFSLCPRYLVCDYTPPQCGGCVSGLPDADYTLAVFIDTNGNANPGNPLPDSGDAIASSCNQVTITGGGTEGTTFVVTEIIP